MTRGPFTYRVRVVTALQRRREAEGDGSDVPFDSTPPILTRRTFPKPAPFTVHTVRKPLFQESTEISGNAKGSGGGVPALTITLSTLRNFGSPGVDNGAMAFRTRRRGKIVISRAAYTRELLLPGS